MEHTYFYPRTPCGVRRQHPQAPDVSIIFLSTYPVRGTTVEFLVLLQTVHISIHVPRAGYDFSAVAIISSAFAFLSTYPVRGTTRGNTPEEVQEMTFLSTYPVRGTTRAFADAEDVLDISIHVPRAGYDPDVWAAMEELDRFLSTYPVRGTTYRGIADFTAHGISIHVPRAGYDMWCEFGRIKTRYFYPRTPCGVRLVALCPARNGEVISIHVPRAGYDSSMPPEFCKTQYFYPRTPCGVRQQSVTNQTICFVCLPKTIEAPGKCFSIFPLKWHIMPTNPVRRCLGFRESLTFALEY